MRVAWTPPPGLVEGANVTRFMRAHAIETYEELVARSVGDVEWFWDAVVRDLGIEFLEPYERVLDTSDGVEWARWFVGGKANLAHDCVDKWAERAPTDPAVVWQSEEGEVRRVTYGQLRSMADRAAHVLRGLGVGPRDTVGIFLPMAPETVAATLACAKLGAIYVPIFSGFGPDAVADAAGCVERVLVWRRLAREDVPWDPVRDVSWDEALAEAPDRFETEPLDAEHPLFIGYTSGTTGRPKGAVHAHGGFLVKIAQEVAYQVDLRRGDLLHWVTDLGWIMGPWELVGAGALGGAVLLAEGSPMHPEPDRL